MVKLTAVTLGLSGFCLLAHAGSDYDTRKREELRLRREHRLAVEANYMTCLRASFPPAKCLSAATKFGEERLARLRHSGHNTPTFRNPF